MVGTGKVKGMGQGKGIWWFNSLLDILIGLFGMLVSNFFSPLYILDISPLMDIGVEKIISYS